VTTEEIVHCFLQQVEKDSMSTLTTSIEAYEAEKPTGRALQQQQQQHSSSVTLQGIELIV